jgi:hypothetical protein
LELSFNLVWSDVLTLSKLEDVLLSIDNLKGSIGEEHTNVTSMYPSFRINGLTSLLWLSKVALEVVIALVANFTTRHASTSLRILIFTSVVHLGHINKLDIKAAVRTTDMTRGRVSLPSDCSGSTAFSLSVTFQNLAAEGNL